MRRVNHETITGTLSLFKILPPNGFNPIRVKTKASQETENLLRKFPGPPGSSALPDPLPMSPCVGGGAQGGSWSNPLDWIPNRGVQGLRRLVGFWEGTSSPSAQGASPPAAPSVDMSNVKGSDEDDYLSHSLTIDANNKIMKDRTWINGGSKLRQSGDRWRHVKHERLYKWSPPTSLSSSPAQVLSR